MFAKMVVGVVGLLQLKPLPLKGGPSKKLPIDVGLSLRLEGGESPAEPKLKLPMLKALGLGASITTSLSNIEGGGGDVLPTDFLDSSALWMKWQRGPYGQKPVVWNVRQSSVLYFGCRIRVRNS